MLMDIEPTTLLLVRRNAITLGLDRFATKPRNHMAQRPLIRFVHEAKAAYPEIAAFSAYMRADGYDTAEIRPEQFRADHEREVACWHIMGFYPPRSTDAVTICKLNSSILGQSKHG
jgi:hypothetical protein